MLIVFAFYIVYCSEKKIKINIIQLGTELFLLFNIPIKKKKKNICRVTFFKSFYHKEIMG